MIISFTPDKNIAMAPPERMEWVPTSSFVNPKMASPISSTILLIFNRTVNESIWMTPFIVLKSQTLVLSEQSGIVLYSLSMVFAQALTGFKIRSFVLYMCTDLLRDLFF